MAHPPLPSLSRRARPKSETLLRREQLVANIMNSTELPTPTPTLEPPPSIGETMVSDGPTNPMLTPQVPTAQNFPEVFASWLKTKNPEEAFREMFSLWLSKQKLEEVLVELPNVTLTLLTPCLVDAELTVAFLFDPTTTKFKIKRESEVWLHYRHGRVKTLFVCEPVIFPGLPLALASFFKAEDTPQT